ncbi:ornithine carbamoyltransferase [Tengunoibacter tsumagoiensis]|uniref:Ornithine carbamoyltransferase n=2 Tax=Tengunoibacter tsumagoiensis TaxID=2014871 RepID=A0A402A383_9CHLR|nr:ornithine carbamoyltransferase [Tengunoibacter tsumagoiensis]
MKEGRWEGKQTLKDKIVGIYFRKTSTRTRTAFTVGASKLGASVIAYGPNDLQINTGETIEDTARVLAGYLDALVLRTAESIDEMKIFAAYNNIAVINAMSDKEHPTQAIADLATLKNQFGTLNGLDILYLGEGNSTAAALALAISKLEGMRLTLLTPEGYGLPAEILDQAQVFAHQRHTSIEQYHHIDAVPSAVDVVYTARWQTTGSSKEDPNWREYFKPFRVTPALMKRISKPYRTVFMHDLPAIRGEDVMSEVLDGQQSIAFEQAHNKLFGAMAVLEWCLLG